MAIFWKNLISISNAFSPRVWIMLAAMTAVFAMTGAYRAERGLADFVSMLCLMFAGWSVLIGPQILRQDLRQDLAQADQLKLFPLPGWQVVLGEILAPMLVLTVVQYFLLGLGTLTFKAPAVAAGAGSFATDRWAYAMGVAVLLPTANALLFCIPNAAVLLFPAWFQPSRDGPHGIEATGQRLISLLAQWLTLLVALIPPGIVFAAAFFSSSMLVGGTPAIPVASCFASVALGAEAAVAVRLLGRWFERFDLSAESVP